MGEAYSDHRMCMIEIKSFRPAPRRHVERVRPEGYFSTRGATAEQWKAFDDKIAEESWPTPTSDNWEGGDRGLYDDIVQRVSEIGHQVFAEPAGQSRRSRPWWDKEAGKQMNVVASLMRLRRRVRALAAAQKGVAGQPEIARLRDGVLRMRRDSHLPPVELDCGVDLILAETRTLVVKSRAELKLRNRKRRMASLKGMRERRAEMDLPTRLKAARGKLAGSRDPSAAMVHDERGERHISTDPVIVKEEAARTAAKCFASERNAARYQIEWRADANPDATLMEMAAREGRIKPRPDAAIQRALAVVKDTLGGGHADRLYFLTAHDVAWLRGRPGVRGVRKHSAPCLIWYKDRANCDRRRQRPLRLARPAGNCEMEQIMDGKDTPLGHMLAVWMAASQRAVVAAQSDWVVTVMPLPSMSFLENTAATRHMLPAVVCRTFDLAGADSGEQACRRARKRRIFDAWVRPAAFASLYGGALKRLRKAAAAGADHLTAELLRRLPKDLHTSLREYLRLALVKRDLTPALLTTVLKWLPKSANEPAYIDNTTLGFPRLRPVGLNTVLSTVFEYILFEMQYKMDAGDRVKVDPMMFAWYRGRRTFSAAMIHQVTVEDASR